MSAIGVLRNPRFGFVLEAIGPKVYLQKFTGGISQLWKLKITAPGTHWIINQSCGKFLDVNGTGMPGDEIIVALSNCNSKTQKWYINSDNNIEAAWDDTLTVQAFNQTSDACSEIVLNYSCGDVNQQFEFQEQECST